MRDIREFYIRAAELFAASVLLSGAAVMLVTPKSGEFTVHCGIWGLLLAASLLLNTVLHRRCMSIILTIRLNTAAAAAAGIGGQLLIFTGTAFSVGVRIFFFVFVGGSMLYAARLAAEEIGQSALMLFLDGLVITEILLLLLVHGNIGNYGEVTRWNTLALLVLFFAVVLFRIREFRPELLLLAVFAGGLLLLSVPFGRFFAARSGETTAVLTFLRDLVIRGAKLIGYAIMAFFLFLSRFFKNEEGGLMPEPEQGPAAPGAPDDVPDTSGIVAVILVAALFLGAIAILIMLLRHFKGMHWQNRTLGPETEAERKGPGLLKKLREFLRKLKERLRFELLYLKNRNSAPGLFTYAERKFARTDLRKKPGESPEYFLRRAAAAFPGEEHRNFREAAAVLAENLERRYYGGEELPADAAFCRKFRRMREFRQNRAVRGNGAKPGNRSAGAVPGRKAKNDRTEEDK